ncbi:DUF485 domain-containing protein [Actinomycetota bacterium]
MGHGPTTKWGDDRSKPFKIKLGLWMFSFYLLLYGGFIVINVVNPKLMSIDIGSLNLAIVYGFSLIIIALIMALIYNLLSTRFEKKYNKKDPEEESK